MNDEYKQIFTSVSHSSRCFRSKFSLLNSRRKKEKCRSHEIFLKKKSFAKSRHFNHAYLNKLLDDTVDVKISLIFCCILALFSCIWKSNFIIIVYNLRVFSNKSQILIDLMKNYFVLFLSSYVLMYIEVEP